MALLQLVIASVAWSGMLLASCFDDFSFVPMDRHLNRGWRYFRSSLAAQRCFAHEFSSHCIAQLVFADALRRAQTSPSWCWSSAIHGAVVIQAFYATLVLVAAILIPPHALPYQLGRVPKVLQYPVNLPPALYGDGASERMDTRRFPWWAQVPQDKEKVEKDD
ncbi:Uncharacterized protein SCF082_LOCUS2583 [Durusdinium trenchii]|uniref:Uncharacterized protein n=1 Tax=Durusdinium trenchii TaxID=1381693 RepID=A0ABP0HM20_9DINO